MKTKLLFLSLLMLAMGGSLFAQSNIGGGSSSSSPSSLGAAVNVKSAPYNAAGNTRMLVATTWAAPGFPTGFIINNFAASTFICPNSSFPCTTANPLTSDAGKKITCSDTAGGLRYSGTITQVNDSTSITVNNVVNSGPNGTNNCFLGTPDDTAVQAAVAAAQAQTGNSCTLLDGGAAWDGRCLNIYFPCGGYSFSKNWSPSSGGQLGNLSLRTDGQQCVTFFMQGDFSVAGVSANTGAFFTFNGPYADSFQLSAGNTNFNFPNLVILQYSCVGCEIHGPSVTSVGNGSNAILQFAAGNHARIHGPIVREISGAPTALCDFAGVGETDVYGMFCSNGPLANLTVRNITGVATGTRITFHGGSIDECSALATLGCTQVIASKDIAFIGTSLLGGAVNNSPGLSVDGTSEVRCSGCNVGPFGANGGSGFFVASGGKLWYDKSIIRCKTSPSACITDNNPINTPGAVDVGGNVITVGTGAVKFAGTALPLASLTHTWNTCYVTGTFGAINLCNQFLDQPLQLIRVKASSGVTIACTVNPVVTITDGSATQTLTITTAAATWDSGALASNVSFASGGTITVSTTAGTCTTPPTNFAVTYNMYASGSQ